MFKEEEKKVVIRSNGMNYLVKRSEVIWIKAKGERTEFRVATGYLDCPYRFSRAIEDFQDPPFAQINRSIVINVLFLEAYSDTWEEILVGGKLFTVALGYRDPLKRDCHR